MNVNSADSPLAVWVMSHLLGCWRYKRYGFAALLKGRKLFRLSFRALARNLGWGCLPARCFTELVLRHRRIQHDTKTSTTSGAGRLRNNKKPRAVRLHSAPGFKSTASLRSHYRDQVPGVIRHRRTSQPLSAPPAVRSIQLCTGL